MHRSMDTTYNLDRFVREQNANDTYRHATDELRRGRKTSHWMWYVFPKVAWPGDSYMSKKFAIYSLGEARAYLQHPVLGPRLRECAAIVAASTTKTAIALFDADIDVRKLHSSMTLFLRADPAEPLFQQVLDRYFGGCPDPKTDRLLQLLEHA